MHVLSLSEAVNQDTFFGVTLTTIAGADAVLSVYALSDTRREPFEGFHTRGTLNAVTSVATQKIAQMAPVMAVATP